MPKFFAESELIINGDGSIFHLHVKPEQLADKVILLEGYRLLPRILITKSVTLRVANSIPSQEPIAGSVSLW